MEAETVSRIPKPAAKSAQEVAAEDSGWSIFPSATELENVGLSPKPSPTPLVEGARAASEVEKKDVAVAKSASAAITATTAERTAAATPASTTPTKVAPPAEQAAAPVATSTATPSPTKAVEIEPEAHPLEPAPADLWVVSYGDDDDRELTEKQIEAELAKGKLTLSTIVWQDGMPEWLPISGVKLLSQYAPAPKTTAARQVKPSPIAKTQSRFTLASAGTSLSPKAPTASSNKSASALPRPAGVLRKVQAGKPEPEPKASPAPPEKKDLPAEPAQQAPQAPSDESKPVVTVKTGKQPPPLPRAEQTHSEALPDETQVVSSDLFEYEEKTAALQIKPRSVGAKPPALPQRGQVTASPSPPWEAPAEGTADEVLTSAPDVGALQKERSEPHVSGPAAGFPVPQSAAQGGSAKDAEPLASAPISQGSSGKVSARPPKPVETATSTVLRTEASSATHQLIDDSEFIAMQRRFPIWALPVAIVGGCAVIGLVVYLVRSKEELPPLPVAPAVTAADGAADQAPPKRSEPNLDAVPTGSPSAAVTDEKDFARLFAQSVGKAPGAFDAKVAERAATTAVEAASRCRNAPDVPGEARAVVAFATSGQVLSVQVAPPYTNSATGRCVGASLQAIRIPPFQGQPGRLSLTIPIR